MQEDKDEDEDVIVGYKVSEDESVCEYYQVFFVYLIDYLDLIQLISSG